LELSEEFVWCTSLLGKGIGSAMHQYYRTQKTEATSNLSDKIKYILLKTAVSF
jgi:hypothetical protein